MKNYEGCLRSFHLLTKFQKSLSTSSSVIEAGPDGCRLCTGVDVPIGSDVKFSLKDAVLLINVAPVFSLKDADLSFKVINVVPFLSMLRLRLD